MKVKVLVGGAAVLMLALIAFIVVRVTSRPAGETPGGVGGRVVPAAAAAAACDPGRSDCLPKLDFVDHNGSVFAAPSLVGKVVVVNFWATWCKPCQKEIPDFNRVYTAYKDRGVVFLGVMTDAPEPGILLNFMSDYEMTYPVIPATNENLLAFGYPEAIPTTFIYDRTGKRHTMRRGALEEKELREVIDELVR